MLLHQRAANSPYLAQMLLNSYYNRIYTPWLLEKPQVTRSTKTTSVCTSIQHYLQNTPESYHIIHLSNILDWLSEQEAKDILNHAYKVLKKGGIVIIRQLNSSLNIPQLTPYFKWKKTVSKSLLNIDRSFSKVSRAVLLCCLPFCKTTCSTCF